MTRWPSAVSCFAILCFGLVARAVPDNKAMPPESMERAEVTASLPPALGPIHWPAAAHEIPGPVQAHVVRVIDGDTFEARVSVWLGVEIVTRVRLAGIDAPELHARCAEERQRAIAAREALAGLLQRPPIRLAAIRADKYGGRVDARVLDGDGRDLSEAMLGSGHAVPYHGGRRKSSCR